MAPTPTPLQLKFMVWAPIIGGFVQCAGGLFLAWAVRRHLQHIKEMAVLHQRSIDAYNALVKQFGVDADALLNEARRLLSNIRSFAGEPPPPTPPRVN